MTTLVLAYAQASPDIVDTAFKSVMALVGLLLSAAALKVAFTAGSLFEEVKNLRNDVHALRAEVETNSQALSEFAIDIRATAYNNRERIVVLEKQREWDGKNRRKEDQS